MSEINFELQLYVFPLINNEKILNSKFNVSMSKYLTFGSFITGFNYYISQSYINIHNALKEQKDRTFYQVLNPFELYLTDDKKRNDFQKILKEYFNIKEDIIDPLFLQVWEIITIFNLVANDSTINIKSDKDGLIKDVFNNFAKKNTKVKLDYNKNSNNICIIISPISENSVKYKESENFINILNNLYDGLNTIKDNGKLIIRITDFYTVPSIKMIQLCKALFNDVYIYKPLYSKPYESLNYVICSGFNKEDFEKINIKMKKSLDIINKNKNQYVLDFMDDIDIEPEIIKVIQYINTRLGGRQHKETNIILKYIQNKNYYGEEYQEALEKQINAIEYFTSNFFPINIKDYANIQKELIKKKADKIKEIKEFVKEFDKE